MVPFLRFGEVISGGPPFPLTSDALKKVLTGQASRKVILSIAHAVSSHIGSNQHSYSLSHMNERDCTPVFTFTGHKTP